MNKFIQVFPVNNGVPSKSGTHVNFNLIRNFVVAGEYQGLPFLRFSDVYMNGVISTEDYYNLTGVPYVKSAE